MYLWFGEKPILLSQYIPIAGVLVVVVVVVVVVDIVVFGNSEVRKLINILLLISRITSLVDYLNAYKIERFGAIMYLLDFSQQSAESQENLLPQLFLPQIRSPRHSSSVSQSPWPSLHGLVSVQHSLVSFLGPPSHRSWIKDTKNV